MLHPPTEDWDELLKTRVQEHIASGVVNGVRVAVKPTNGPTGHGFNGQPTPPFAILVTSGQRL